MYRCQTMQPNEDMMWGKCLDICRQFGCCCYLMLPFDLTFTFGFVSQNATEYLLRANEDGEEKRLDFSMILPALHILFIYLFSAISFSSYLLDLTWLSSIGVPACQHFGCLIILTCGMNFVRLFSPSFSCVCVWKVTAKDNECEWLIPTDWPYRKLISPLNIRLSTIYSLFQTRISAPSQNWLDWCELSEEWSEWLKKPSSTPPSRIPMALSSFERRVNILDILFLHFSSIHYECWIFSLPVNSLNFQDM